MIAGRYRLVREIGRGGMGAVWLGTDTVLGRDVALKSLRPEEDGGATTARAAREAQLAARLNHRHVVAVFDLVEEDGRPWLVMEYVEGSTLRGVVDQQGPLTPDRAATILGPVAAGLHAAHRAGVIHRDVKPSNILVSATGEVKLTDFGIARGAGSDLTITGSGVVTGSPAYLSPEVAQGMPATPASDVWSLGATLYFAVTGHAPYDASDNVIGAMYQIVHGEPPRTELAGRLRPVLIGSMTRDPDNRWSMADVHRFLTSDPDATQYLLPGAAETPPPPDDDPPEIAPEPGRSPRRRAVLIASTAVAVAAVIGLALLLGSLLSGNDDPSAADDTSSSPPKASPTPTDTPPPPAEPTEQGIRDFVTTYLNTASSDPEAGFGMLTPEFQDESGGIDGYAGFWGSVQRIDAIHSIEPEIKDKDDDDELKVKYDYTYSTDDGASHTEKVKLELLYEDGTYLIADD